MTTRATFIRDQIMARLTTPALSFNWKSTRMVPIPAVQADQLPSLGVFLVREVLNPEGDAKVGRLRYINSVTVGISVMDNALKAETLDGALDPLVDLIEKTLLTDISFVSLDDGNGIFLESIEQITRSYSFPQDGENFYMEARLQMTFEFRTHFEPVEVTPFTEVDIHVSPFDGTTTKGNATTVITLPQ